MLTTENILIGVCVMAAIWILQLELRVALNDKQWPPVRHKMRHALAAVFKKDRRLAEISLVLDDSDLNRLLLSNAAFEMAQRVNWDLPPFPMPTPVCYADMHNLSQQEQMMRYENAMRMKIDQIGQQSQIGLASVIRERATAAAGNIAPEWTHNDNLFMSDDTRRKYNEASALHKATVKVLADLRTAITHVGAAWYPARFSSVPDLKRQLLANIEEKIPR